MPTAYCGLWADGLQTSMLSGWLGPSPHPSDNKLSMLAVTRLTRDPAVVAEKYSIGLYVKRLQCNGFGRSHWS